MSAKLDLTLAAEPHKMSGASSAAPSSGQKLSLFSPKSGFVIPKNKLSGSLVPIFRGSKNHGVTRAMNEENSKQVERQTKWGPDMTSDAAVKRGKALALQIRVDQITKQLESEKLELGSPQKVPLVAQDSDQINHGPQFNSKKSEMLELERREAIGEMLKLDPSFKPPPGFKPLLKEASIPLPIQEYPGYNFVGLIYGLEGGNQKRLEKETGAKIKVHGTKAETGEKGEIKPGADIKSSYKEMHVNISADSFDKVDAAVSIIELLITSVTGNLPAGPTPLESIDCTIVPSQSQDGPLSHPVSMALENQVAVQPIAETQMHGDHLQYSGPWFSAVPSHNPMFSSSGNNIAPQNPSGLAGAPNFLLPTMNPSNMSSAFGVQPVPGAGFHPTVPNQHVSMPAPPPRQILHHSHMTQRSPVGFVGPPRNHSIISAPNFSAAVNASMSFPVTLRQSTPIGQLQTTASSIPQPIMSGISPASIPNQPLTPLGDISGQIGGPVIVKVSADVSNMGQMAPPAGPPTRPASLHPTADVTFRPVQSNMPMLPRSSVFPPQQAGISSGQPLSLGPMPPPVPASTHLSGNLFSRPGSYPLPQQSGRPSSASGVTPHHNHVKPPVLTASNSGNFTFQSHRPNTDTQAIAQCTTQEPPSFGFSRPDRPFQNFQRMPVPNQLDQTQAHLSAGPFAGRSGLVLIPPRHTAFPYAGQPAPRSHAPQMGMNNLISAPQMENLPGLGVPRSVHVQQNYPAQRTWPGITMPPNQKLGNTHSMASSKLAYTADQIYDPFSPTSIATPQQKGNAGK